MATNENLITLTGNLTDDPDLRFTPNGIPVATCRMAVNRRKRNQQTNEWEDALDGYFNVNVWREYAENVAESLKRGTRVVVTGRLISRSYETKDGETRWVTEIEADEICPSLKWARARIEKNDRRSSGGGGGSSSSDSSGAPPTPAEPPSPEDVPF